MADPLTLDALADLLAAVPTLDEVSDEHFVLDSLALTWLVHLLEERHGMVVDIADPRLSEPTTLRRLLAHLNAGADEGSPPHEH